MRGRAPAALRARRSAARRSQCMGVELSSTRWSTCCPRRRDCGAVVGTKPRTAGEGRVPSPIPRAPLAALVFKTASEQHLGDLSLVRIYSGTLEPGKEVCEHQRAAGREDRASSSRSVGKERTDAGHIAAGDIVAAVKLRETHTGDTLSDKHHPVVLPPIPFPEPWRRDRIAPKTRATRRRWAGPRTLHEEDPTLHVHVEASHADAPLRHGRPAARGHGRAAQEALRRRGRAGKPRVPYRETIRARPGASTGTRSRPAAAASSARSTCGSSR